MEQAILSWIEYSHRGGASAGELGDADMLRSGYVCRYLDRDRRVSFAPKQLGYRGES
jgi:hypothetical protein